jgi:pyruvate dehydrogenase E2 component (dihydrolipoamide acetyltransferase)
MSTVATDPETGAIAVAGRRVNRWIHRGGEEAVVLVHGFGGDLASWRMNLAALAATGMTVAALDLPGHGDSSKLLETGALVELMQSVLDYMDAERISSAHLVGHSMGAAICLSILANCRQRVRSLTLVGPAGLGQPVDGTFIRSFIAAGTREQVEPVLRRLFADPGFVTPEMVEQATRYRQSAGVTAALTKIATGGDGGTGARSGGSLRAGLGDVPTLILWGGEDSIIPAPEPAAIARPGVAVHVLPGAGHMVQIERAAAVNELIVDFLGS